MLFVAVGKQSVCVWGNLIDSIDKIKSVDKLFLKATVERKDLNGASQWIECVQKQTFKQATYFLHKSFKTMKNEDEQFIFLVFTTRLFCFQGFSSPIYFLLAYLHDTLSRTNAHYYEGIVPFLPKIYWVCRSIKYVILETIAVPTEHACGTTALFAHLKNIVQRYGSYNKKQASIFPKLSE